MTIFRASKILCSCINTESLGKKTPLAHVTLTRKWSSFVRTQSGDKTASGLASGVGEKCLLQLSPTVEEECIFQVAHKKSNFAEVVKKRR